MRLCGQAMNACARAGLATIMGRDRPGCPVIRRKGRNRISKSWLEPSKSLTVPAGRDRLKAIQEIWLTLLSYEEIVRCRFRPR